MLVEALVAAVLLVVIGLGFFSSLDSAAKSSASNRHRSVAAALAQSEMERMRAMKQFDPSDLSATRTQVVGTVTYTIASNASWVDDASSGASTCAPGSSSADYLKVTTTVTWPTMGNVKPVKTESLFAVRAGQGSIKSQVVGASGAGIQGIDMALGGPQTPTGVTDAAGCLFFGYLAGGTYTANVNESGYVDKTGAQSVTQTTTVASSATSSLVFLYDRAATLNVSYDTKIGAAAATPVSWTGFTVSNSGLPAPNTRSFSVGTAATTVTSGATLFPFSDGYAVWGGSCAANDPTLYTIAANIVPINPGATQTATARLPALNIIVKNASGTLLPAANVRITPPSGCGSTFTGALSSPSATLANPALPFGDYSVCANANISGTQRKITKVIQNRLAAGSTVTTLTIPSSGSSGVCP